MRSDVYGDDGIVDKIKRNKVAVGIGGGVVLLILILIIATSGGSSKPGDDP